MQHRLRRSTPPKQRHSWHSQPKTLTPSPVPTTADIANSLQRLSEQLDLPPQPDDVLIAQSTIGNQATIQLLAQREQRQAPPTAAPTQTPMIQRDLMDTKAFRRAFRRKKRFFKRAPFNQFIPPIKRKLKDFHRLAKNARNELNAAADEGEFREVLGRVIDYTVFLIDDLSANTDDLLAAIREAHQENVHDRGRIKALVDAEPVVMDLKEQLADEAMVQILDIAIDAERRFKLVTADETPGATQQAGDDTTDGGVLVTLKEKLGSGAINTVSLLQSIEDQKQYVFKADQKQGMLALDWAGSVIGDVDESGHGKAAAYSNRAVATYELDRLFGFGVIPETKFAIKDGYFGHIMELAEGTEPRKDVQLSLQQMAYVKGKGKLSQDEIGMEAERLEAEVDGYYEELYGEWAVQTRQRQIDQKVKRMGEERFYIKHAYYNIDYSDREIQQGLTNLQLIDLISGQLDRHPGNYFIGHDSNTGRVKVTAIDNDAAFGASHTDLKEKMEHSHLVRLPQVVSLEQYQRIKNIDPEGIRAAIGHLLSENEVEATVMRFNQLSDHLDILYANDALVADFNDFTFEQMMSADEGDNAGFFGSYVGREAQYIQHLAQISKDNLILDVQAADPNIPSVDPDRLAQGGWK